MNFQFRLQLQLAEVRSELNRWYCSQHCRRPITDDETLFRYYVWSGGAADFAARFTHAMSDQNRWYCSQFYRRDIRDPQLLWDYYMKFAPLGKLEKDPRCGAPDNQAGIDIAC